ncbi:MAG: bifunctional YncE family protein/alkaline phosphatase family protein [Candidatus Cybelea sp.]
MPAAFEDTLRRSAFAAATWLATAATLNSATGPVVGKDLVPSFQRLEPAGESITFPARPLDIAISSGGVAAIKTSHGILFVDVARWRIDQTLMLTHELVDYPRNLGGNGMLGIVWNSAGTQVWSTDGFGLLRSATRSSSGRFSWDPDIELPGPSGDFRNARSKALDVSVPAGLAMSDDGRFVFVALSRNGEVLFVDAHHRKIVGSVRVGVAPLALLRRGQTLYVANLGGAEPASGEPSADSGGSRVRVDARGIALAGSISLLDIPTRTVVGTIRVGRQPEAMALSRDGRRLFVMNANDDTISIVDTAAKTVVRTLTLPLQRNLGASPSAVTVSPRDGRLFVAEGGDNRLLVLDGDSYAPAGQIATGWYPDGVTIDSTGNAYVISLKGWGSRGTDFGFNRTDLGFRLDVPLTQYGYNVYDNAGLVQSVAPRAVLAATSSDDTFLASPASEGIDNRYLAATNVPIPIRAGQRSLFKHVVYIIKENHTYDDYFGDLRQGNGDARLCAFPEKISPNHHALARRFGLFDNVYVNGTMSGDGHQWTDEGGTTDYVERNTASWAKTYPSDGTDPLAYVSSGFIWQRVLDAGLTFRDYGEFTTSEPQIIPANATWSQFFNDRRHGTHFVTFKNEVQVRSLAPYVDPAYAGFSLRISDQARADEFLRDLARFDRTLAMPSLILLQLGNDHTAGTDPGYPAPASAVADNDLALGRIVQGISRSSFWKSTVIFVVEDDAQNGVDHVDGHRTMALVVSAYNRRRVVDSHFYNQTSILRTIEQIFDLRPLTQFDALAPIIVEPFGLDVDPQPYDAVANQVALDVINPKVTALSGRARQVAASLEGADFGRPDAADPRLLTESIRFSRQADANRVQY